MKRLLKGDRVRVVRRDHPLFQQAGTVVRVRMADDGAWVEMDGDVPEGIREFPAGDPKARHVMLYPDQCGPVRQVVGR